MIKLLDCTLRDGGYVNDWNFGKSAIIGIKNELEKSGVDIIELGFLRDEESDEDRSVFNSITDIKKLIGTKRRSNTKYAVMAEVSNPFPLEDLEPYTEGAPEIIRVIVWKRMLKEGFEYCKGIVEKGYKLFVQPARVNQYSDEEFVNMIKMFNKLNPMAIYVVDSWGTMYKDELLHYLQLADDNLKAGIAVGYHGHNNMMQAFDVAQAFCEQKLKRDLIVDASVYGIGRGAGNLNTEIFAKYMNERQGKNYDLQSIFTINSRYIGDIYKKSQWGYSVPYLITAKHNCNPSYASYYEKCRVPNEMVNATLLSIPLEDKIIFSKKKAIAYVNKQRRGRLAIILVTANRPDAIDGNLSAIAEDAYNFGVDVIVFDSSNDDRTKKITENFSKRYDNVFYDKWNGIYDEISIDDKVIEAYKKYSQKYEYIWQIRDGLAIFIRRVLPQLEKIMQEKKDVIIVDDNLRDYKCHGSKSYTDAVLLFKEQCVHLNTLGTYIVKDKFIQKVIEQIPLDDKTYGLYCPMAFFYYWAKNEVNVSSWVGTLLIPMRGGQSSSFWTKKILFQWAERWFSMINNLPSIYDDYKKEVLLIETCDFKLFSLNYLIKAKKYGGLTVSLVNKYKSYIKNVSKTPLWKFYVIAILPRFISKKISNILERMGSLYNYNLPKKSKIKKEIINYEQKYNCFGLTKDIKSNLLYGSQDKVKSPFITVFIPTYKRLNLLKEAIDSVLKQRVVNFEWNIIIVDNEPYNGVANATEKYIKELNNEKIAYYRNDRNLKPGDNFNRGIYLAKAPWVMMLHDDDLLFPYALSDMKKSIEYLKANDKKELGAICVAYYQLTRQNGQLEKLNDLMDVYASKKMSYKYFKLTHSNVLLTGHIGGGVPTCGTTFNKKAVLDVGGFNENFGISADLILYYCLENKYSVYSTSESYGIYLWGENQMSTRESAYNVVKDNFDFREYVFSKNLFYKFYGWLFRDSLYYVFTKVVLKMRRVVTADYTEFYYYADIHNKKPSIICYTLYKIVSNIYELQKRMRTRILEHKIKKYINRKKQVEETRCSK